MTPQALNGAESKLSYEPEAERQVIAAALLSPEEVVPVLRKELAADDFYDRRHQLFFATIVELYDQNAPITAREVVEYLERDGKASQLGDLPVSYLTDLMTHCAGAATISYYVEKIKDAALRRETQAQLLAALEKAKTDPTGALDELLSQRKIAQLTPLAPTDSQTPLEFPDTGYVGLADEFADTYATACEAPKSFFYLSFLTCLGALAGDRVVLQGATQAPARLYTVLLGPSGLSRKSTAIRLTTDFFAKNITGFPIVRGLGSAEGLAKTISKRNYTNCLLVFDELRTFVDKAKIEGSILLSLINTLYDETRAENHTKGYDIELNDVHLSLLSACTLDTFSNLFDAHFVAIGFPNRLLLALDTAKERIPVPRDVPLSVEQSLARELEAILYQIRNYTPSNPLTVKLTPDALRIWAEFYPTIPRTVTGTRLDSIGLRLAMLIALSAGKLEIDSEIITAAIAIAKWQLAVREEVMPLDAENRIAAVEQRILKTLKSRGPLRERDLRRLVNAHRVGMWVFSTALENLAKAKEVVYDPKKRVYAVLD